VIWGCSDSGSGSSSMGGSSSLHSSGGWCRGNPAAVGSGWGGGGLGAGAVYYRYGAGGRHAVEGNSGGGSSNSTH